MNLVLITQHFAPRFEGGTELVARAQATALKAAGIQVSVISGTDTPHRGEDVEWETVDGIPVAFLPRRSDEAFDLDLLRPRITDLIEKEAAGADVAHLHHWSTLSSDTVQRLAASMPVVVTLHDLFTTCPRFFRIPHPSVTSCPQPGDLDPCVRCVAPDAGGMTPAALEAGLSTRNQAFAAELAAAAAIVVPSRTQRDRIAALTALDARRLHVIPHGLVGTIAPPGAGAPSVRAADGNLRILHLGHRAEVKGTLDLVQAISALEGGERSRVCLLLLGAEVEPGFDDRLRDAAQGVQLEFLGSYDRGALSEILSMSGGADLVALPSRAHESYGLVTDEALALGLPVWVSDRGAPAERVGAAGRVLPAAEPRAWTRALREVLLDPGILAAERAAVPERLPTAADAALKLLDLYPMLLGQDPETQP